MMAAMARSPAMTPPKSPLQPPALMEALGHSQADKRLEVLRQLALTGSISQAARDCGISYKAAWQALDTLTNLAGVTLVERSVGGAGGGGASLTEAGHALLRAADAMEQVRSQVLARLQSAGLAQPVLARLAVRTSMRNQWPCAVQALQVQGSKVIVHLQGAAHPTWQLRAHVTRESAELMGLQPGQPVLAMAKATAVQIGPCDQHPARQAQAADSPPLSDGSDSVWCAEVLRPALQGADEVAVRVAGGVHVVGFVPAQHASSLPLHAGQQVEVRVPASAVVLALVEGPGAGGT